MMSLAAIELMVSLNFSDVPQLGVAELLSLQNAAEPVFLIDVRAVEEYEVSRIPGAVLFDLAALEKNAKTAKSATHEALQSWQTLHQSIQLAQARQPEKKLHVVAYCSVGWRSSAFIRELKQKFPFTAKVSLYNLKGSIFKWSEQGYALENARGRTELVHGYAQPWVQLLPKEKRVLPNRQ
jgi:rhodanese-related sulfurtransferase